MSFAAVKLVDIAARSLFLLIGLYSLPDRSAGQFGLAITLVGIFVFLAGFERYADLQRTLVGKTAAEMFSVALGTLRFFTVNQLLWTPPLVVLLAAWVELPLQLALLYVVIAIAEHLSQEAYRIALIAPRYLRAFAPVVLKNVLLCFILVAMRLRESQALSLEQLTWIWALTSLLGLAASGFAFLTCSSHSSATVSDDLTFRLKDQYWRSRTHFCLGLVALGSLQLDRFVVGGLLSLEDAGIYLRYAFLASFAHSVLTVISYNRILPAVYAAVNSGAHANGKDIVRRANRLLVKVAILLVVVFSLTVTGVVPEWALRPINVIYLGPLLIAVVLRMSADYNALLLNASHRESDVFRAQLIALLPTLILTVMLTFAFSIYGTVAAYLCGSLIYLSLANYYSANERRRKK